ncbi:hypothetical protein H6G68_13515 [Anabaena catenula FACHB-362]|uniref:Calx-beta domain-containing protein n=1 Tax=Anabaena catenula FACHB-362 TaxID=2692877 RepID=A0ABR8J329_9NOST|nr:hypothetical protein [Anabaena catenula FACHB-362]
MNVSGETVLESDESFSVTLINPTNGSISNPTATAVIRDDDPAPTLAIAPVNISQYERNSGNTPFTFTVTRTGNVRRASAVNFAITGSGANPANAADFGGTLPTGTINFASGEISKVITINVSGDKTLEQDENFTVTLSNPTNNTSITTATAISTILYDDTPLVSLSLSSISLSENAGSATLRATLSEPFFKDVTVKLGLFGGSASRGIDYNVVDTLVIPAGSTTVTTPITILNDILSEGNETFSIDIISVVNGVEQGIQRVTGTIIDDDPANISIVATTNSVNEDGSPNLVYTVSRTGEITTPLTVYYTISGTAINGQDYSLIGNSVVIPAGKRTTTIRVDPTFDRISEPNETVTLTLQDRLEYNLASSSSATGTIVNDDTVFISVNDLEVIEGTGGTKNAVVKVSLQNTSSNPIIVSYITADNTATSSNLLNDFTASSGSITIPAYATEGNIVIPINPDNVSEKNENFFVRITNITNNTRFSIVKNQAVVTIVDDDTPPFPDTKDFKNVDLDWTNNMYSLSGNVEALDGFLYGNATLKAGNFTVYYLGFFPFRLYEENHFGITSSGSIGVRVPNSVDYIGGRTLSSVNYYLSYVKDNSTSNDFASAWRSVNLLFKTVTVGAKINFNSGRIDLIGSAPSRPISSFEITSNADGSNRDWMLMSADWTNITDNVQVRVQKPDGTWVEESDFAVILKGNLAESLTNLVTNIGSIDANKLLTANLGDIEAGQSKTITVQGIAPNNLDSIFNVLNVSSNEEDQDLIDNLVTQDIFFTSNIRVAENSSTGTVIGSLVSASDNLTLSLLDNAGGRFAISGTDLVVANGSLLDYETKTSHDLTVQSIDAQGAIYSQTFTIDLVDQAVFTIANQTITEGNSGSQIMSFTVSLTDPINAQPALVNYATVDGTAFAGYDYTANSGTLFFNPGETSKTIDVEILGDTIYESNETFSMVLTGAGNGTIAKNTAVGTIVDNDLPVTLSVVNTNVVEGNSGTKNLLFQVGLSAVNGQQVTVNYSTANGTAIAGSDYTATTGTLTFLPGTTVLNVAVPIVGDVVSESDETLFLNISNATGGTVISKAQGTATIINDDGLSGGLNLIGTTGNDILSGAGTNDTLKGLVGADVLDGQGGADRFVYNALTDSLLTGRDAIRSFNPGEGDRINVGFIPGSVFNLGSVATSIGVSAVTAAYTAANSGSGVGANEAVFFTTGSGRTSRLYLSVNDGTAGFNANNDLVIEVTGMIGAPSNVGALTANNYFATSLI